MTNLKERVGNVYAFIPDKIGEFIGISISRGNFWFLMIVLGFIFLCAIGSHTVIKGQVKTYAKEHAKEVYRYSRRMNK